MPIRRTIASWALFAAAVSLAPQSTAKAGPLLDWLFGYRHAARPAYPVGPAVPVGTAGAPLPSYAGNYGNYYGSMMPVIGPSGYGYRPVQPSGITAATAPAIMSYVPDYRTSSYRAPVTYYRPIMTTDPNTGAQVVALAPCTSYEYQAQRIQTFGYNGMLGSYSTPPVQPAPQAMPTYTLPAGGVPLAANAPTTLVPSNGTYSTGYGSYPSAVPFSGGASALTPSISSNYGSYPTAGGYTSNYGGYSVLQPALTVPPAGAYPTAPYGSDSGYYGAAPSGGSCGNSVPRLSVPSATGYPAPGTIAPGYPAPGYTPGLIAPPAPTYQSIPASPGMGNPNGYTLPPNPSGNVFPPAGSSSSDPNANVPPSLPSVGMPAPGSSAQRNRPQLRSIVRQPLTADASAKGQPTEQAADSLNRIQVPSMMPIPAPAELESQPRWNPGLLDEQDRTALRPVAPSPDAIAHAGQAKAILWASFTTASTTPAAASNSSRLRAIEPATTAEVSPTPSRLEFSAPEVRPLVPVESQVDPNGSAFKTQPSRPTGGWKSAR